MMSSDPIPKDHITLDEALHQFRKAKWGSDCDAQPFGDDPLYHLWRKLYQETLEGDERELAQQFLDGELEALVSSTDGKREYRITRDEWAGTTHLREANGTSRPERRMFHSDEIFEFSDASLAKHRGRTPYTPRDEFETWLKRWVRDWLITWVAHGRRTPEEAEAIAARVGCNQLEVVPKAEDYRPLEETHWSLTMAVAWIAWGTEDAVRKAWKKHCDAGWFFTPEELRVPPDGRLQRGWHLKQPAPSISHLELSAEYDRLTGVTAPLMSVRDALKHLWMSLSDGTAKATAVRQNSGNRKVLEAYEWQDLELAEENGEDVLKFRNGVIAYRLPSVPSAQITSKWCGTDSPVPAPSSPEVTESDLTRWFKDRVKNWPKTDPCPNERKDWEAAKQAFPGKSVSRAVLRSARKTIDWRWRRQGQRRARKD